MRTRWPRSSTRDRPTCGHASTSLRGAFDAHLRGTEPGVSRGRRGVAHRRRGVDGRRCRVDRPGRPRRTGRATRRDACRSRWPAALAILIAALGVARLAWSSSGPTVELAVVAVVVGHVAVGARPGVATLGGPYGAVTAIAQSVAAMATVGVGLGRPARGRPADRRGRGRGRRRAARPDAGGVARGRRGVDGRRPVAIVASRRATRRARWPDRQRSLRFPPSRRPGRRRGRARSSRPDRAAGRAPRPPCRARAPARGSSGRT